MKKLAKSWSENRVGHDIIIIKKNPFLSILSGVKLLST